MAEPVRVVIIEDDPMVQEVHRQFVERVPWFQVVGTATNGAEGIRLVKELRPDLIILDVYMPTPNGLETMRQLRADGEPVDILVITAAKDPHTIQTMLRNGAFDYLVKPFQFERLKRTLEHYRQFRSRLTEMTAFSQAELDRLLHGQPFAESGEPLPKGLNDWTLRQVVLLLLEQSEPLSAEEVAEQVGIARVTARRYLDYLEKTGRVNRAVRYGGIGRPVHRYQLTNPRT